MRRLKRYEPSDQELFESERSFAPAEREPEEGFDLKRKNEEFEQFWEAYPRKTGKVPARKSWLRLDPYPAIATVLRSIELHGQSDQWKRQIIPLAATWLNQRRFDDERPSRPIQKTGIHYHVAPPEFEKAYREAYPGMAPRISQSEVRRLQHQVPDALRPRPERFEELVTAAEYLWKKYREQGFQREQIRGMIAADIAEAIRQGPAWISPVPMTEPVLATLMDEADALAAEVDRQSAADLLAPSEGPPDPLGW